MTRSVAKSPRVAEQCDVNIHSLTLTKQLVEFERGKITDLQERGFSNRAIGARVQRNSSTALCTNVGFVNSLTSAAPCIACKGGFKQYFPHGKPSTAASAMGTEPGKLIGTKLSFHMNHASICGTMMAAFILDAMQVNADFQSALSNDIVAYPPELCFGVGFRIMNDPICYELRVISIAIVQHMQLLPWPAYSLDMSPIEHVWDWIGQRLAHDPRPEASKDDFCCAYKQY
ncbi:uncharacterized protein TNCV_2705181 [Trichonephila clavipes]|nr:uncharacterized protein TNCV_2705181 [Trichonephila clavipes]